MAAGSCSPSIAEPRDRCPHTFGTWHLWPVKHDFCNEYRCGSRLFACGARGSWGRAAPVVSAQQALHIVVTHELPEGATSVTADSWLRASRRPALPDEAQVTLGARIPVAALFLRI
jgi:hypothetical protein